MNNHLDYINHTHDFDFRDLTEGEIVYWGEVLLHTDSSITDKKKALGILAHVGNLTAYQSIKEYSRQPDEGLEEWAKLALGECTLFLHGELCGDDAKFVFTGVGANNDMLRIYFMLLTADEKNAFEAWQYSIIEKELSDIARNLDCEIEWFKHSDTYIGFSILMPVTVSLATFIEKGIADCNQFGSYLLEDYYAGTGVPDEQEIKEIIRIVRYGEEGE